MKSNSNIKPEKSVYIGNGKWHYNYNIVEVEREGETFYDYDQITLRQKPEYDVIVPAIIREKYSECDEMAIINKYNAFGLGLHQDIKAIDNYKAFLVFVENVKKIALSEE